MTGKTRNKRERDQRDELLVKIDFKGLAQEEMPKRGGLLKQLAALIAQIAMFSVSSEQLFAPHC
jgi:hypothetical protein